MTTANESDGMSIPLPHSSWISNAIGPKQKSFCVFAGINKADRKNCCVMPDLSDSFSDS
jgi:hypothetical protein